ncbi:MAG: GlsB/YeaQ/YmgE family stress response membrane protein [Thermoleophilaceae bacterium]|nr:GlsB/YeaQ/YmgE family stress response membrane protein [Thermoleophilaceae bacterium]
MGIISWTLWGLLVGFIARAVLPGRQAIGIGMTIILGVAGSLLGGFIATQLGFADYSRFDFSSLFGAVVTSVILLLVFMRLRTRSGDR